MCGACTCVYTVSTHSGQSAAEQGLTHSLVHFSAQHEHFLWDVLGGFSI